MVKEIKTPAFFLFIFAISILFLPIGFIKCHDFYIYNIKGTASAAVVKNLPFEDTWGESRAYELGLNAYGKKVFRHKEKAFQQIVDDYPDGFTEIQQYCGIKFKISKYNWRTYEVFSWQTPEDSPYNDQATLISEFLYIYKNSFE